jgi:hypothetical protein
MNERIKTVIRAAYAWREHTLGSLLRPFGKALWDAINQLTPEDLAECGMEGQ